jgi:riboflavin synthase
VGDSIAINGCCLTIVEVNGSPLAFDVSAETLSCTLGRYMRAIRYARV